MTIPHDDTTPNQPVDGADEAGDSAAETQVSADEAQRRELRARMLELWRAGVARLPEVAWRDAGATSPLAVAPVDDDAGDAPSPADAGTSWWSMPKTRAAG